jgi:hypothetical protein
VVIRRREGYRRGLARIGGRVLALVQPRADILGVLALQDQAHAVTEDSLFAARYGATVFALELCQERNLAEIELSLRRELVDDLLAGTDRDGAYARADALGHDLRRPHYVAVVQTARREESTLAAAAARAATALNLNYLLGHHCGLVVMLTAGHPDPRALHHAINEGLETTSVLGIGTRCKVPDDLPRSFIEARRALNIRLRSANPEGAAAYDELGFYRLIDAANGGGTVEGVTRWRRRSARALRRRQNRGPTTASELVGDDVEIADVGWCGEEFVGLLREGLSTGPPRCVSRAASSGNASMMPNVDGPNRTANHGLVPVSCSTSGSAERRNSSTASSLPDLASSRTSNALVAMVDLPFPVVDDRKGQRTSPQRRSVPSLLSDHCAH